MRKIFLIGLIFISVASFGQLRKDQLNAINARDIKAFGSYSSLKLGKLIDSLILSLNSQRRASGYLPVGNASGIAVDVPLSGDGALSSAGSLSVTKILGNTIPSNASGVLTNNGSGTLSWGAAVSTFQSLTDGPGSFSGKTLNYNRVNAGETALEYRTASQVLSDIAGESVLTFSNGLTRTTNTIKWGGPFTATTQMGSNGSGNFVYDNTGSIWNAGAVGAWYGTPGNYSLDYAYWQAFNRLVEFGVRNSSVGKNAFFTIDGTSGAPTVKISGSSGFAGLQEASDLSGNYTSLSHINKGYAIATFAPIAINGTVTSVASSDGSITVTNPTTTVDLAIVKSPILTTSRTIGTITGDATSAGSSFNGSANNTNALTLATVNSNVGTFGSATTSLTETVDAKGRITAVSSQTVTPAVGSITGLGSNIATWLATPSSANLRSALTDELGTGAALFDGATPTSFIGTNITGTAPGLTVGNVTTNANLTGPITSVGNATSIASQTGTGTTFAMSVSPAFTGTPSLPTGTTVVTQSPNNNSTAPASTAYADAAAAASGTSTPMASTISKWDANVNLSSNNFLMARASTATAAGTTTLTIASKGIQDFTGSTTQTVTLPVASTCSVDPQTGFRITNFSTGVVTVNSSGGNVVQAMDANSYAVITCILASGTTAASWNVLYLPATPLTTLGDLLVAGASGVPSRLAASTAGYPLISNGVAAAPTYQVLTSDMTQATNTNSAATAGYIGQTITGTPVTSYTNFTTSATYKNISSIALTAGNWIINATFTLYGNSATITTTADAIFVVSTTTASATGAVEGKSIYYIPENDFALSSTAHVTGTITFEVKLSGSQTYYLNGQGTYSGGNMQYVGSLEATRPR